MKKLIDNMMGSVSPESIKKYGLYAILSFFISLSVIIGIDDIKVRNTDVQYERAQNDALRKVLDDQYQLKQEQENLIKTIDTVK